jgi:hypothetical protein
MAEIIWIVSREQLRLVVVVCSGPAAQVGKYVQCTRGINVVNHEEQYRMRKNMGGKRLTRRCCEDHRSEVIAVYAARLMFGVRRLTSLLPSTTDCQNKQIAVRAGALASRHAVSVRCTIFVSRLSSHFNDHGPRWTYSE